MYQAPTCWKQWRELQIDGRAVHRLTVEQCQAVFAREDFSFLSDDHKAAVSEQLSRERFLRRQKQAVTRKAAAVGVSVLLFPVVMASTLSGVFWFMSATAVQTAEVR